MKKKDFKKITKEAKKGIKGIKKEGKKIKKELKKAVNDISNFDPMKDFEMPDFDKQMKESMKGFNTDFKIDLGLKRKKGGI